jgi:Fe-S cluster biogenesis protein NfuA
MFSRRVAVVVRRVAAQRASPAASSSFHSIAAVGARTCVASTLTTTTTVSSSLSHERRHQRQPRRTLFVQTQDTPNPLSLKFLPGKAVLPDGAASREFRSYKEGQASPLAVALFAVDGVATVFFGPDFISVNLEDKDDVSWGVTKPAIFTAITEFYASGAAVFVDGDGDGGGGGGDDTRITDDDSEVVAMIKELIETRIRPFVQQDGGDILYRRFDEETGVVALQLQGSCSGCPSSSVTLKSGIENMLKHYVEEVTSVEEFKAEEDETAEAVESVSESELRKLEEGLARVKANSVRSILSGTPPDQ